MRVLIFHGYLLRGTGSNVYNAELAAALARNGHEVHLLCQDRDTGEPMEIVGQVLPSPPSSSSLPWAVENLRFCNWCDQLAQKDLNDCPTCGRRMGALPR